MRSGIVSVLTLTIILKYLVSDLFFYLYNGGVVEWLKAADCKSARVSVRRFESYPLHQYEGMEKVSECVSYKAGVA